MKSPAVGLTQSALLLLPLMAGAMSSCTPGTLSQASKHSQAIQEFKLEELATSVPTAFADAQHWNKQQICPEGSVLTPFTRYSYEPGQVTHGFKHYYGRGCTIVHANELAELTGREPASVGASISLMPHGPYIWWYESGAKMEGGSFDHGTLALGHLQYEPDGSLSPEE